MTRSRLLNPIVMIVTLLNLMTAVETRAQTGDLKSLGDPVPFSFASLKGMARDLAGRPYQAPSTTLPDSISHLTWDEMQHIQFREPFALWRGEESRFRVRFFHLGLFNKTPVKLYELHDGAARQLAFDPALFDYQASGVNGEKLPPDLGFAGFQLAFHTDWQRDITAFQGASYFRAVGEAKQYGLSARGLAINCGLPGPEEFPRFTAFWLERPAAVADHMTVYALLDSPSVAGAYRIDITPGEPLKMDVDAAIYSRQALDQVGIAPLTSMFLCGENDRRVSADFRPEIHDSDGLSIWTGKGEWIWRPLVNPSQLRVNSFLDDSPRGFGLLQRDRLFDHYQDDGAYYDRRPSLWIEPKADAGGAGWKNGAVRLVEIPSPDETFDNIVAFWNRADKLRAGEERLFSYRMYWGSKMPFGSKLAIVAATRTGIGGVVGSKRAYYSRRFAIDFTGGELATLSPEAKVEPIITASRGKIEITSARPLTPINGWRAIFDVKPTDDSIEPIDLRLYLRSNGQALTETWLYQWTPPPPADRKF